MDLYGSVIKLAPDLRGSMPALWLLSALCVSLLRLLLPLE